MKLHDGDVIVFAGDSTTDADKRNTSDGLGNGYVRLIRNALFAFHPENNFRAVNAGVGGNTSAHLLARWDRDVISCKPDVLFCMIGINDVWRHFDYLDPQDARISVDEYAENLAAICEKSKGVREFYLIPPYYLERNRSDEMRVMTEQYADRTREVAARYGITVVEVQPDFDAYMNSRPGQSISWDRVHPFEVGSMIIARRILRFLDC